MVPPYPPAELERSCDLALNRSQGPHPTDAAFAQIINVTIVNFASSTTSSQSRPRSGTVQSRKCGPTHGPRTVVTEYLAAFCRFPKINSPSWSATTAGIPRDPGTYRCPKPCSARPRRPTSSPMSHGSNKSPNRRLPPLHKPRPVRRSSILLLQPVRSAKDPRRPTLMKRTLEQERFRGRRPLPGISRQTQSLWKALRRCQPIVYHLCRHRDQLGVAFQIQYPLPAAVRCLMSWRSRCPWQSRVSQNQLRQICLFVH